MCGRFVPRKADEVLAEFLAVAEIMDAPPGTTSPPPGRCCASAWMSTGRGIGRLFAGGWSLSGAPTRR